MDKVGKRELLVLDEVSYSFPSGTAAVSDVTLCLDEGERVALMGANGSGKSTVLRLVCGLISPDTGRLVRSPVAYVAQDPHANIIGETVEEDVRFAAGLRYGEDMDGLDRQVQAALELVGMDRARKRTMHSLSGGEIQRVALAAAALSGARLWVLDEPTSYLPRSEARDFWVRLLKVTEAMKVGLLYATHHPQEARHADRIYCLHGGRVAMMGHPEKVLGDPDWLRWLGVRADVSLALGKILSEKIPSSPDEDVSTNGDESIDEKVARALWYALNR